MPRRTPQTSQTPNPNFPGFSESEIARLVGLVRGSFGVLILIHGIGSRSWAMVRYDTNDQYAALLMCWLAVV